MLPVALCGLSAVVGWAVLRIATADDAPAAKPAAAGDAPVPLNKNGTVLLDKKGKRVLLTTNVALREGQLEMLCCLKQTKEHESILSLDGKAYVVHTALLALGAKPGATARYTPDYNPPTGQKIDIFVSWIDEKGKSHRHPAAYWIRNVTRRFWAIKMDEAPAGLKIPDGSELRYDRKLKEISWYGHMTEKQKAELLALSDDKAYRKAIESFFDQSQFREMKANFVFAGSGFFTDEDTGKKFYLAEDGDLICVANMGGAMLDVAMESSAEAANLLFEAWTERIPPKGTPVTLELVPVEEKEKGGANGKDSKPAKP